ncbi:MAG: hydrogenase iron-sulfur subunit [Proteobacteria bacterium]|nr:hydrogenase iron-sulfur subunit [Pseudomonadota bacterium]
MAEKKNKSQARIGVFLCECGRKIAPRVDLKALEKIVKKDPLVTHVQVLPFTCMAPGIEALKEAIAGKKLDRVCVAGCEPRILLKKFNRELAETGLEEGQIDMVNLRDHVAQVYKGEPADLAEKGAKLISAAVAGLDSLDPTPKTRVEFNGPVMIVGGGVATYSAAQELLRREVETIIAVSTEDVWDEIRMLHEHYPGERQSHERLTRIMEEVDESPFVRKITVGEIEKIMGRVGDYTVTFSGEANQPPRVYQVGTIIAALDGQMLNQGSDFGHDGVRVLCHTEMEEYIWLHGAPTGRIVFWINDMENSRPWSYLSARAAWNMACFIRDNSAHSEVTMFYNDQMPLPLSAGERVRSRELGIEWVPYDANIRPTVQNGFVTFNRPDDQIEQELSWDKLCLSPLRSPGIESIRVARVLGLDVVEGEFLERNPQMVRPEMIGQDERFIAGSARKPCDLRESLRQGRRAAQKAIDIFEQARRGELYAPRMVCTVDQEKCIGCGLCKEICDCGGIQPVEGPGGNIPREVDPMVCTGGGTCAAACPYHALTLQNNTTAQREARVAALARRLADNEVLGFGCNWGGAAAADHAGLQGLTYDPRFYMVPISCIGQLDPNIIGRAFLEGANGVLLIGCPPEECHHSYGLDHTWSRVNLVKKMLALCGLDRRRVALAHADLNQPERYVVTVESFLKTLDELGPIDRDEPTRERIQALYDTLNNSRVRWVLGASLRRPWETTYPSDQRNALAYDETLSDVLAEEFVRVRVMNLLKASGKTYRLDDITAALGADKDPVLHCLKDLTNEGMISRIFKDRTPYYTMH